MENKKKNYITVKCAIAKNRVAIKGIALSRMESDRDSFGISSSLLHFNSLQQSKEKQKNKKIIHLGTRFEKTRAGTSLDYITGRVLDEESNVQKWKWSKGRK